MPQVQPITLVNPLLHPVRPASSVEEVAMSIIATEDGAFYVEESGTRYRTSNLTVAFCSSAIIIIVLLVIKILFARDPTFSE